LGSKRESLSKRIRETLSNLSDEELAKMLRAPAQDYTPFARRAAEEEVWRRERTKATELASGEPPIIDPGAFRNESPVDRRAGCYIELWSGKNFEGEYLRMEGPCECRTLEFEDLDWRDSISSLRVGPSAFVLMYSEKEFNGDMMSFGPGQDVADLVELRFNDEIDSIKLVNSMKVFDGLRAEDAKKPEAERSPEEKPNKKGRRRKT